MARPKENVPNRFWAKVRKTRGCWIWTGATVRGGYGFFWDGKRNGVAHRYSYRLKYGPIPKGKIACHKCDNPKCVNPDHLFIGTYQDNELDKYAKGRDNNILAQRMAAKTHCKHGHPFDEENTVYWVQPNGKTRRRCRTCRRMEKVRYG